MMQPKTDTCVHEAPFSLMGDGQRTKLEGNYISDMVCANDKHKEPKRELKRED
jgi:hypothetical protein